MAGALRVELGGLNYYGGIPQERARMGKPDLRVTVRSLRSAVRLMAVASVLALVLFTAAALASTLLKHRT